jgi:acyl-CoA synthetase (AMP-forming)/AMP-acid ligase II
MPALLARWRPSIVTGVPTMFARLLPLRFEPEALAALRVLRCGSAPITEELQRRIEAHFGLPLVISYGLSEATCTSTMNPPAARRIGSVGTVLAGQDVFLRDAQGGRITRPGAEGEICIAGPSLMSGYLDESQPGRPQPPGDLLRTGDLGRFDADGYLSVTGRIKDVIIRGGENLSPGLIEETLAALPGVRACCVVGRADADLGEVPVAVVVRSADAAGAALTAEALQAAVRNSLSRIHVPAAVLFADALPENAVGKVDRKRLARELAQA